MFKRGLYVHCRLHCYSPRLVAGSLSLHAQAPLVGASDRTPCFHSSDPKLNANKQAAYHIVKICSRRGNGSWRISI